MKTDDAELARDAHTMMLVFGRDPYSEKQLLLVVTRRLLEFRSAERERAARLVQRELDPQSDRCERIVAAIRSGAEPDAE